MDKERQRLELISKVVIFLPFLIIVLWYLRSSSYSQINQSQVISPTGIQQTESSKQASSSTMKFNLNGPYYCSFTDNTSSAAISIKNRKMAGHYTQNNVTTNLIISGDCGYTWVQGKTEGDKMCNIGQYLSMADTLSSLNLLDFQTAFSVLPQKQIGTSINKESLSELARTCKKQEVSDEIFTIPKNISFTDMKPISISPAQK